MLPEHFQEKIKFLEEALQINLAVNATWAIAENYNNFGLQHLYAGKYKKALDYLEKAREKAKTINAQEILMDNLNYCAQIYHKIGDMANAYESLQQLHQLEKQIFITDRISNIERRIAEKKLKESEQQVRIEQKQNQLQTIQKRYLLGISALLLTTLLIIIFQVRVRQKIKIQKLAVEQELHEKNNALINYQLNAVEIEKNNAFTALDIPKNY
jgi:tetratricopeptide (TPR) repeat protein